MQIEAKTLALALIKAAKEYNCSAANLDFSIVQSPRAGLFGLFSKTAIIEIKGIIAKVNIKELRQGLDKFFLNGYLPIDSYDLKIDGKLVFINLHSKSPARLIGKQATRYHAFYYLLYTWLKNKYKMKIRLEAGNYLEKEIRKLEKYLKKLVKRLQLSKAKEFKTAPLEYANLEEALLILKSFDLKIKTKVIRHDAYRKYILISKDEV